MESDRQIDPGRVCPKVLEVLRSKASRMFRENEGERLNKGQINELRYIVKKDLEDHRGMLGLRK